MGAADIPTARSNPISRVRSCTDSASVFAMPMTAITIARNNNRVDQVHDGVDLRFLRPSCTRRWSSSSAVGYGFSSGSIAARPCSGVTPGFSLAKIW